MIAWGMVVGALALLYVTRTVWLRLVAELIFRRDPDFRIQRSGKVYLLRWWVLPRNRWFNLYLHHMLRDDQDEALHDHPWVNVSIVVAGGYFEQMPSKRRPRSVASILPRTVWRKPGSIVFRRATTPHRLTLPAYGDSSISFFVTGPVVREWGFLCPKGWVHWKEFVKVVPGGNDTGRGCP